MKKQIICQHSTTSFHSLNAQDLMPEILFGQIFVRRENNFNHKSADDLFSNINSHD